MSHQLYDIKILHPKDSLEEWDRFVDSSAQGSIYSKSFWLKAISAVTGGSFEILAAYKGGNLFGGIGLHIRKSFLGNVVNCPILTPYNSILLKKQDTRYPGKAESENLEITEAIIQSLDDSSKYSVVEIKNSPHLTDVRPFSWKGWGRNILYTYEIALHDFNRQAELISHSVNKQIRKCRESGVHISAHDDPEKFYRLFSMPFVRQQISLPITWEKFRELMDQLKQHECYRMYFAELENGEAVSARIALFSDNEIAHDWVAGADPQYFQTGATVFLLWKVIEDLAEKGYKFLDLNGANIGHIAKFKSEFGGRLAPYYEVTKYNSPLLKLALMARRKIMAKAAKIV